MNLRARLGNIRNEHVSMLLRGLLWQLMHLRFEGILFKGRGARIWIDRRVRIRGILKVGDFAKLDLRFCISGTIGPNFSLGDFSVMRASGSPDFTCPQFDIGPNVSFGPYCNIGGGFGLAIAGDVIAGPYVSIHPEEHGLGVDRPIRGQSIHGTGIRVGRDCWLSAKATLLDGTNLADGTVLGAGAILVGSRTEPNSIYVGVPARLLRLREENSPERISTS
ncbi:acyltransferase [Sulfitobacter pseudonitzschiae]|uniref:Acyltransferase n=1 Tax=Pseudosulfitobacter pseudonitzschiae TaxID=1402135 RepID=A0A9Q2P541_9RHOB|nr:acyltransferase [Pseudosulfitobacter pseudonitzschiae]MBM2294567.1 acyltransferase [Pseudosulfitobacter pseudonitzschiae]MBM2299534.1 acyltransferase [Pseudosulfitobacter pseudonitzschiae]MBM2304434.1 acyltransferase [Pseudosulfitobacter pseudonitzschiae]MBM2314180.1 acyltransferase [Pseudosulfitobacter pseudonitzschiae]MBM2319095.1 acyltransferase [Pseudosulfitobacter pseudonitzschiae]